MRHLRKYKLFEGLQNNEDYLTVSHLLYDLFDDWGIVAWTGETFDDTLYPEGELSEGYPTHKFWVFRKNNNEYFNSEDLNNEVAKDIVIFNISSKEMVDFKSDLEMEIEFVKESIGKDITISEEIYVGNSDEFADYIIKIK